MSGVLTIADVGQGRVRLTFTAPHGPVVVELSEPLWRALDDAICVIPSRGFSEQAQRSTENVWRGRVEGALELDRRSAQVGYCRQGGLAPDLLVRGLGHLVEVYCDLNAVKTECRGLDPDPSPSVLIAIPVCDQKAEAAFQVNEEGHGEAPEGHPKPQANAESGAVRNPADEDWAPRDFLSVEDAV